jgi:hypothetical protein
VALEVIKEFSTNELNEACNLVGDILTDVYAKGNPGWQTKAAHYRSILSQYERYLWSNVDFERHEFGNALR